MTEKKRGIARVLEMGGTEGGRVGKLRKKGIRRKRCEIKEIAGKGGGRVMEMWWWWGGYESDKLEKEGDGQERKCCTNR